MHFQRLMFKKNWLSICVYAQNIYNIYLNTLPKKTSFSKLTRDFQPTTMFIFPTWNGDAQLFGVGKPWLPLLGDLHIQGASPNATPQEIVSLSRDYTINSALGPYVLGGGIGGMGWAPLDSHDGVEPWSWEAVQPLQQQISHTRHYKPTYKWWRKNCRASPYLTTHRWKIMMCVPFQDGLNKFQWIGWNKGHKPW